MIDVEKYNWSNLEKNKKACDEIRKDCSTARGIIADALNRYVKKKLSARSKKQAADMTLMFKDLEMYVSENDIQDAYGWEFIDEEERDRLIELWRKREQYVDDNGKFRDRVTDMVERAMNSIGEEYIDFLTETEAAEQLRDARLREIEENNIRVKYERQQRELRGDGS